MSQICPSSSHQLVAAANAFRRARRKFPKNYGLCGNSEDSMKLDKTESLTMNEDSNDQENLLLTSGKCSKPKRNDAKSTWSDDYGESGSIKENLLQKPIICSCCRKRNEAKKANEPTSGFKTKDQCNSGDAFDVPPSKEYNADSKKSSSTLEQSENSDTKPTKSFITESKNSSRCHTPYSYSQKRSPKETSLKSGPVNLLYDRTDNEVKRSNPSVKRNGNAEEHCCVGERSVCKLAQRNSRSKLNFLDTRKDNSSPNVSRTHDFHCEKHSNLDVSRPRRDCCHNQSRHPCYHLHDCWHHCCDEGYNSCSKGKPRLSSDTCLCSLNSTVPRGCCNKHVAHESTRSHDYCQKDTRKISTVQERNDEEYDDCVGVINHKDSLCILVEKFKASKKCKHKKCFGDIEFSDEQSKDKCSKSLASDASQVDDSVNTNQREKYSENRFRDNNSTLGKTCRHDCNKVFKEGNCHHFKDLKSRLIKTGTCCSPKGTPWRHTF